VKEIELEADSSRWSRIQIARKVSEVRKWVLMLVAEATGKAPGNHEQVDESLMARSARVLEIRLSKQRVGH
jgi:hypothetical protein